MLVDNVYVRKLFRKLAGNRRMILNLMPKKEVVGMWSRVEWRWLQIAALCSPVDVCRRFRLGELLQRRSASTRVQSAPAQRTATTTRLWICHEPAGSIPHLRLLGPFLTLAHVLAHVFCSGFRIDCAAKLFLLAFLEQFLIYVFDRMGVELLTSLHLVFCVFASLEWWLKRCNCRFYSAQAFTAVLLLGNRKCMKSHCGE
jgi:hypothetical protein